MVNIDIELLNDLIDSLSEMIGYADDGIISRGDPEYKDFFDAIDKANEVCRKANEVLENEIVCKFD